MSVILSSDRRRSDMSNLAQRLERREYESVRIKTTKVVKKRRVSLGEKVLAVLFCGILCVVAVKVVTYQASIYEVNKNIHQLEATIQEKQKVNGDLAIQVSELSTYERIWDKALQLGLMLNENNVKVVQE